MKMAVSKRKEKPRQTFCLVVSYIVPTPSINSSSFPYFFASPKSINFISDRGVSFTKRTFSYFRSWIIEKGL